ncbi:MAG: exodeoxyribonuclease VII large subunit [Terriglobales bacterium]
MNSALDDSGQLGLDFAPPTRRIWTVGDLISAVRTELERAYTDVFVEGEISNFSQASSGHLYFTLKENGAQLRVVMFRSQARLLRFRPENGLQVIVRGRVTVYEARGELQLSAEYLEPRGAGALQLAFEQLKVKLGAEGLFDPARKKPIPEFPRCVGIVTSPRGAAIQDILNILRRRHESVRILIYPAQVQGEAAPEEVTAGVYYFNREGGVDVIIVTRGGGSPEDLAAFNDESLARAVAGSALPVISAVGHETDFTICDFVADLRAPTPSAAAEMVIRSKQEVEQQIAELGQRLIRGARYQLLIRRKALMEWVQHGAFVRMGDFINRRQQRVDDLLHRLATAERELLRRSLLRLEAGAARIRSQDPRHRLAELRQRLQIHAAAIEAATQATLLRRRARLEQLTTHLCALSPLQVLERGYALVFDAQGQLITDAAQVSTGEDIQARVARGTIAATVKKVSVKDRRR